MSAKYAALLGAIIIDSSNKDIRRSEAGAAATVSIVEGTYFLRGDGAADDLCLALKTALETGAGANTYTVSVTRSVDPSAVSGVVTITRATGADTFAILWADALTSFDEGLLGFTDANTADNASAKSGTLSPAAWWVSSDVPSVLEPEDEYDVSVVRSRSGRSRAVRRGGPYDLLRVRFLFIDSRRVLDWDNTADVDATFAAFLERNGAGTRFELHLTTVTVFALAALSSSTERGAAWVFDEKTSSAFAPDRLEPGMALYAFDLVLLGYVA